MGGTMWRVGKHEGFGNVVLEQIPIPDPGPDQVLVRTRVSLISRGSELWARYEKEQAVDPGIMGYSTTGVVERLGPGVTSLQPGDRVAVVAPHAEYSLGTVDPGFVKGRITPLHPNVGFEEGTFPSLSTSGNGWTQAAHITPDDRVVVLGQGIVGNLLMQFAKRYQPAQLIAVDALDLRCDLARQVGGPRLEVVNAGQEDPIAAVKRLTGGAGATIVVDCVGGRAGVQSFAQAQQMLAPGGLLQLIGLYHGEPQPLDASKMMGKRLIASYPPSTKREVIAPQAMFALASGEIQVEPLITHRFPGREAKQAFDFLYQHPEQAMGVLMIWD
jgi:threonine 3-dehydrogenase